MQTIQLEHPYSPDDIINQPIVLALGFFDGVHLGHQAVITTAKQRAEALGIPLAVLTFNQHPKIVYEKLNEESMYYLSTLERKQELLVELGVDILYLVNYTFDFGDQSPQQFVDNYIVNFNAKVVVAGFDYSYGKPGVANMETLPIHSQNRFEIIEVPKLTMDHHKIGSTIIRSMIGDGQLEEANSELGYTYQTSGVIVHGEKRGSALLGYPTANVETTSKELLPGVGIYVVEILVNNQWHQGMASIGRNVTFGDNHPVTCEVFILDFDRMIYGESVQVKWHHYLRGEVKFDGIDGLIAQLDEDLAQTRTYFNQLETEAAR